MKKPENTNSFSSYIIGNTSLCIQCAEILLEQNHVIHGIASSDSDVQNWSETSGIACWKILSSGANEAEKLLSDLTNNEFEYLFSIMNPLILPERILSLPQKFAVNYHYGPLPKYAGVNAPSWAIINQEKTHGITWHIMEARVDVGDILKQTEFEINENDTSMSLNTKCFFAAISSFQELISELETGAVINKQQDLQERSFIPKENQPEALCTLFWSQHTEKLDSLVRALDFGPYQNSLGVPKFFTGNDFVIISKLVTLNYRSLQPPGTILVIDDDHLQVSTNGKVVAISGFQHIDGQPMQVAEFVEQYDLHPGVQLPELDQLLADRITSLSREIRKYETYWVNVLKSLNPIQIPHLEKNQDTERDGCYQRKILAIPAVENFVFWEEMTEQDFVDLVYCAFIIYLSRLCEVSRVNVGYRSPTLRSENFDAVMRVLFSTHVPLVMELSDSMSVFDVHDRYRSQEKVIITRKTFANDVGIRYPEIRGKFQISEALPVMIETISDNLDLDEYDVPAGTDLIFIVKEPAIQNDIPEMCWIYDSTHISPDNINKMQNQYLIVLDWLFSNPEREIGRMNIK